MTVIIAAEMSDAKYYGGRGLRRRGAEVTRYPNSVALVIFSDPGVGGVRALPEHLSERG